MPVVLRFGDSSNVIKEEFIKFIHCKDGTTEAAVAELLKSEIKELCLELSDCRGQGYEGAGNLAGKYNGAAALIKNDYPLALYVHCSCHRLDSLCR